MISFLYILLKVIYFIIEFRRPWVLFRQWTYLFALFIYASQFSFLELGSLGTASTWPLKFSVMLMIKMKSHSDQFIFSLTNSKNSVFLGAKLGSEVNLDYRSSNGSFRTIKFNMSIPLKTRFRLVLIVSDNQTSVSINCEKFVRMDKPSDFPTLMEVAGSLSVGAQQLNKVVPLKAECKCFTMPYYNESMFLS